MHADRHSASSESSASLRSLCFAALHELHQVWQQIRRRAHVRYIQTIRTLSAPFRGIPNTCRRVKASPISDTPAQSTSSAFHPSWSNLLCDEPACSTCRAMLNAIPHFCSPPRLCLPCAYSLASSHAHIGVVPITLCVRQPLQQAHECAFASVPPHQSPSTNCPTRLPAQPSISTAIARITTPNARIYPHLIKRYDLKSNLPPPRTLRFQRHHSLEVFYP